MPTSHQVVITELPGHSQRNGFVRHGATIIGALGIIFL